MHVFEYFPKGMSMMSPIAKRVESLNEHQIRQPKINPIGDDGDKDKIPGKSSNSTHESSEEIEGGG